MRDSCVAVHPITASAITTTETTTASADRMTTSAEEAASSSDDAGPSGMEIPSSGATSNHHRDSCYSEVAEMGSTSSSPQTPDRSSQCSPVYSSTGNNNSSHHQQHQAGSPKHVTDGSETSEYMVTHLKRKSSLDPADDSADETNHSRTLTRIRQPQQPEYSQVKMNGNHHDYRHDNLSTKPHSQEQHQQNKQQRQEQQQQQQQNGSSSLKRAGPVFEESSFSSGSQQHEQEIDQGMTASPQHERTQEVEPLDISYRCTPASLKLKEMLVSRLSMASVTGRIQVIDLSRRGLGEEDAELISSTLRSNPQLAVLKLGYNNLSDRGTSIIASACSRDGRHHRNLTILDLGFNNMGDEGCTALCLHMVAGNHTLRNLFLSGNNFKQKGAIAIAGAILHGCSLSRLHLSANALDITGIEVLAQAIAESESRIQLLLQRQGGIKAGFAIKPVTLEEIYLDDTSMKAKGLTTLSSMLMTNHNLKVISLANNDIDDRDMVLLSQALSQNKEMPLKSLFLSFNKITCVGVECLMNAVWGSPTLREIKLDNNKMQDRGAQLCSVVLSSIRLEVLDISFNRISTVGIKTIMKSLSENDSLQRLSLSGIPMDQNASKAVSYALAYNQSLQSLNIDSCSVGYSGQRHIVAGIVSNRNVKLRVVTGFPLAPITMTLGLPQLPEDWGNDRVLSFVRYMWAHWQSTRILESRKESDNSANSSRGPAPPSMVAASAKRAFASLSHSDDAKTKFQIEHQMQGDDNPMIAPDTAILVRSNSGQNLQLPSWDDQMQHVAAEAKADFGQDSWSSESDSLDRSSYSGSSESLHNAAVIDHERRNMNLAWLRSHTQSLNEVRNLAFNNADLWQLHQYFFSPAYTSDDEGIDENKDDVPDDSKVKAKGASREASVAAPLSVHSEGDIGIGRASSFQLLGKAIAVAASETQRPNKRGSLDEELKYHKEPSSKRAKNLKPRIAFYPRVREKLESLGTKPSTQTLALLRQLKYIESVMLRGTHVYVDRDQGGVFPNASDVEMVVLDLL